MSPRSWVLGLGILAVGCTGAGIDSAGSVPSKDGLSIRPVADPSGFVRTVAETAQRTLVPLGRVEVESTTTDRSGLSSIDAYRVRSDSKDALREAVNIAGPRPKELALAYEHEPDGRLTLVMVHEDEGFSLGSKTRVKLNRKTEGDSLYLLLGREDGRLFETLTTEHDRGRLAILDGDSVLTAPTVNEPIRGGQLRIDGGEAGSAVELYEALTGREAPTAAGD